MPAPLSSPIRVLHVINDLRLAGAERFLSDLAPRQRASGVDVSVAALAAYDSPLGAALEASGVSVALPLPPLPLASPAQVPRLAALMRGVDFVHVQLFPAQLWVALAGALLGRAAPVLVTTEQNTHNRRREKPVFKPLDRWMYRQFAHILAISDATRDTLTAYLPETAPKISIAPNGIDPTRFGQAGSPEERAALFPFAPLNAPILLSIGRLEPQKDIPTLLRATAHLEGCRLCLVGVGALRAELDALAASLGITERVHFLGARSDIPALLRNCDVYVQSSVWEGFGIAAVEAMASGVPVVITDVPGLREVVGDAGVRVPPGDPAALAGAITAVCGDAARRAAMGQAARARAAEFGIDRSVAAHAALYRRLLRAGDH